MPAASDRLEGWMATSPVVPGQADSRVGGPHLTSPHRGGSCSSAVTGEPWIRQVAGLPRAVTNRTRGSQRPNTAVSLAFAADETFRHSAVADLRHVTTPHLSAGRISSRRGTVEVLGLYPSPPRNLPGRSADSARCVTGWAGMRSDARKRAPSVFRCRYRRMSPVLVRGRIMLDQPQWQSPSRTCLRRDRASGVQPRSPLAPGSAAISQGPGTRWPGGHRAQETPRAPAYPARALRGLLMACHWRAICSNVGFVVSGGSWVAFLFVSARIGIPPTGVSERDDCGPPSAADLPDAAFRAR